MLKLGQNLLLAGVYIDLRTIAQKEKTPIKKIGALQML
ncbi:hypothetical protein VHP8226_04039 [Vibrio hippocampi]|uniref:Uncharacterized protein n=1 Tax=Vibrio hippocampi TaxID=654686 RepID=A0ABM8ZPN9_9VIBR|nr:hypothetical protein VHP8226_04039 [Vibrio hippocampi]